MKLIDTDYDERYESRGECRRRIFNSDKVYLFYLNFRMFKKRQIAIFGNYSIMTDDFQTTWKISRKHSYSDILYEVINYNNERNRALSHNTHDEILIFELTDSEVERQVYMELI